MSVGEIVRTKACLNCKHQIKEWVGLTLVTCESCKDSLLPESLTTRIQVRVSMLLDGVKTDYILKEKALEDYFDLDIEFIDDAKLKVSLLRMKDVVFQTKNNNVFKISKPEIEVPDELLSGEQIGKTDEKANKSIEGKAVEKVVKEVVKKILEDVS